MNIPRFAFLPWFTSALILQPPALYSQGAAYLSNLGRSTAGSVGIGSNAWFAHDFTTGTNSPGYFLGGVLLSMRAASGVPAGFSVFVYSNTGASPGSLLATLAGPDPTTAGIHTYAASDLMLSLSTRYWIVLTSQSPLSAGEYNAQLVAATFPNYDAIGAWAMGRSYRVSPNGLDWTSTGDFALQFGISAAVVPEPSSVASIGVGAAVFGVRLFRRPGSKRSCKQPPAH